MKRGMVERRGVLAASIGLFVSGCAGRASPGGRLIDPPDTEITRLVRHAILRQRRALGAVVATLEPSGRRFVSVQFPEERGPHYGSDTIFEIASLSKVFTALLLAEETVHGRVTLDDPLQAHVPQGIQVPSFEGQQITLADLATHGSGLPLRPANLAATAPDAPDKYAGYTLEQLYAGLPGYRLDRAPGSRFEYSNLGIALLGHGLANATGEDFPELLKRRVIDPLGLKDTTFGEDHAKINRRAQGYDSDLNPSAPSGEGALDPSGGLRSTANDILTLLNLFLNHEGPTDLVEAARLMLSVDRPGIGGDTRMALGWRRTVANGETYYWSNGSGDGSRTFMGFNMNRRVGVVALADSAGGAGLDDIARRVLDPQHAVDTVVVPRPEVVALPESVLSRALGTYRYAPDDQLVVTRGATGLILEAGPNQIVIQPQSATRYISRMAPDIAIDFEGAGTHDATTLVLHQSGQIYRYGRVP